jgi:hypothetical protein
MEHTGSFDPVREIYLVDDTPFVIRSRRVLLAIKIKKVGGALWTADGGKIDLKEDDEVTESTLSLIVARYREKQALEETDIYVFESPTNGEFVVVDLKRRSAFEGVLAPYIRNRTYKVTRDERTGMFHVNGTPINVTYAGALNADALASKRIETMDGQVIHIYMDAVTQAKFYELSRGVGFERYYGFITPNADKYVILDLEADKVYLGKIAAATLEFTDDEEWATLPPPPFKPQLRRGWDESDLEEPSSVKWSRLECNVCGIQQEKAHMCSGCRSAIYCGTDCQNIDWIRGGHKERCSKSTRGEAVSRFGGK